MTPPVDPILIHIGSLTVYWYGLLVVTGIFLGAMVAAHLADRAGVDPEQVWDMLLFAVIGGIIGARIEYVVTPPHWAYYREHLTQALMIWEGGLRIYGAIIGGALGVLLYSALYRLPTLTLLDFSAPGMALGHAIGRWGNFINHELYGPPTTLPWGLDIPPTYRIPPYNNMQQYPPSTRFHPAFLYESLANLTLCLLLMWLAKRYHKRLKDGTLMVLYLMAYSAIRFFMDYLRTDGTTAQPLALAFVALGALFLVIQYQPWKKVGLAG